MRAKEFTQGVAEGKIKLSTDPNWYGAEVGDYKSSGPIVNIPANRLVGFEPDDKMNQPASKANVEKIIDGLKQGAKLPPLLVRQYKNGYQVLDGHHRFWAYKLLGVKSIPAQVVPAEDIEEITKQGVAEVSEDKRSGKGDCFEVAGRAMIHPKIPGLKLVHAYVSGQGKLEGQRFPHAWNEVGDVVFDNSNGRSIVLRKDQYYDIGKIVEKPGEYAVYNDIDAKKKMVRNKHYGPWDLR